MESYWGSITTNINNNLILGISNLPFLFTPLTFSGILGKILHFENMPSSESAIGMWIILNNKTYIYVVKVQWEPTSTMFRETLSNNLRFIKGRIIGQQVNYSWFPWSCLMGTVAKTQIPLGCHIGSLGCSLWLTVPRFGSAELLSTYAPQGLVRWWSSDISALTPPTFPVERDCLTSLRCKRSKQAPDV